MTSEETNQIRTMLRKSPRTIWGYWPFIFPVLFTLVGAVVIVGLVIYWETKMPDLEVLFRRGTKVAPIADSQSVREAVMLTAMSIAVTFMLLAFLARLAFRQVRLLRAAARDLGIEDGQQDAAPNSRRAGQLPASPETRSSDSLRTPSSSGCG